MARRQKEWARRAMQRLRERMGGACACCGDMLELEMDCIIPQGHAHHRLSMDQRATFYRRQFEVGNLQLLCAPCHAGKSKTELPAYRAPQVEPEMCPF